MPKDDTIDAIMKLNPSAKPDFLVEFSASELKDYLDQLQRVYDEIPQPVEDLYQVPLPEELAV